MTIFSHPTLPAPPCFALRRFFLPHKGGGAEMEQDFSPVPQGGTGMDLDFLDPPHPTRPRPALPRPVPHY